MNPLLNKPSSNPSLINDSLSKYVCSWLKDQKVRQDLIARIQYKKQKQQAKYLNKIINDESLSQQYFKIWMQQPVTKPLLKLAMHPLLQVQDQKIIDQISSQQRNDQIKFSCQLTAGTISFYWIFFSRMAKFQRFFNDRNKSKILNGTKKILAIYAVLIAWQASLSSHYQKKLPDRVNQKGLFKKYGIQFEDKNI